MPLCRQRLFVVLSQKIGGLLTPFPDAWHVIGPTGLEQQYGGVACLSQAARHHRTGRARSADDEIVGWSNLRREPALVGVDAGVELGVSVVLSGVMLDLGSRGIPRRIAGASYAAVATKTS
jgi:hypothetical protein